MSRWWRAYDEAVDDPKLCLLTDKQHRAWFNLCCITSQNDGKLPPIAAVAFKLRMTIDKAKLLVAELVVLGLIDETDGIFSPHNWGGRQYKSDVTDPTAASRQKTYRERNKNRNGDRNATVTNTDTRAETEQITDSETEQKSKSRAVALDDWPENYGDVFWQAYPRKEEKISAMKKLAALRKSGIVTFADLMAGVKRYCAAQREPQFTKQPTAWLNKGCWADEIKAGGDNGDRSSNSRATGHDAILAAFTRKAREIVGDDAMARPADATEFSFGNGAKTGAAEGNRTADCGAAAPDDGGPSAGGRVLEGEIIPPDKLAAGISGNRR